MLGLICYMIIESSNDNMRILIWESDDHHFTKLMVSNSIFKSLPIVKYCTCWVDRSIFEQNYPNPWVALFRWMNVEHLHAQTEKTLASALKACLSSFCSSEMQRSGIVLYCIILYCIEVTCFPFLQLRDPKMWYCNWRFVLPSTAWCSLGRCLLVWLSI